ncbi:carbon monoxide dehydrogenase subunit G [Bellilinea sp.]|jgi:carbon monoxide dehydrogenase subunit G|uniref:Carbon monoxide dehydrogenase n=1 Tax=Bellilinea caldifistulae TaxID=360411 RepID=A0A7C4Q489_9CHLR|nr:carbon monoxide dehydrogenase subunit G [Bellilinea sp.]
MKLEGEHVFNGPREAVWEMFYDPEVLASALPGTQKLEMVAENEYEGAMNVRIGPVSGSFTGKLVISDVVEPESCTLTVDGRGTPGFAKGVGRVQFIDQGDGTTLLKYEGEMNIGGSLASVGQRMIDSVAKTMIRQAFEVLDKALEARLAAKASGSEVVDFKPPSETEFAAAVAKDMAGGLTKIPEVRLLMYIIPLVAVLVLLAVLFRGCSG